MKLKLLPALVVTTTVLSLGALAERIPASFSEEPIFPVNPYVSNKQTTAGQSCHYSPLCPDGRAIFWGQQRLNADLMFQFLNEKRIDNSKVKVAVVDTGFDWHNQKHNISSSNFNVSKGHRHAGDERRDQNGHGTAVAGMIASINGVGLAPHVQLTVYRVTSKGDEGSATTANINDSIQKACDEGHSIINVSWGGVLDENGISEVENSQKDFYENLYKRGCLVIRSAGNSAKRQERAYMTLDDGLLRVEASQINSFESDFSSKGEVRAPGSGVYTLRSTQVDKYSYSDHCGDGKRGAFVSGTSFSAPLTAAIAAQVEAVLRSEEKFAQVRPQKRVDWITRILAASSKNKNIDANRAVRIADVATKHIALGSDPISVEELQKIYSQQNKAYCENPTPSCPRTASCDQWRTCLTQARARYSRCPAQQPQIAAELFALAQQTQAVDVVVGILANDTRTSPEAIRQRALQAEKVWKTLYSSWIKMGSARIPFDLGLDLLPHLVKNQSFGQVTHHKRTFSDFFQSLTVLKRLSRRDIDQAQEDTSRVLDWLAVYAEEHGKAQLFENLTKSFQTILDPNRSDAAPSMGFVAAVRVWAEFVHRAPKDETLSPELIQLGRMLIESIQNIPLKQMPHDTVAFDLLFERQEMRSFGQGLLAKYSDRLVRDVSIAETSLKLLDWYIFEKRHLIVPLEKQPATFLSFMRRFEWKENELDFGQMWFNKEVTQKFYELAMQEGDELIHQSVVQEFWDIVYKKNDLMYWTTILPVNGFKVQVGDYKEISYDNALLKGEHVHNFLQNAYQKIQNDRKFRLSALGFICDFLTPSFDFYKHYYKSSPKKTEEVYKNWFRWSTEMVIKIDSAKISHLPHGVATFNCLLESDAVGEALRSDDKLVGKLQLAIDNLYSRDLGAAERHADRLAIMLKNVLEN